MGTYQPYSGLEVLVDSRRSLQGHSVRTQFKGRSPLPEDHTEIFDMLSSGHQFDEPAARDEWNQPLRIIQQPCRDMRVMQQSIGRRPDRSEKIDERRQGADARKRYRRPGIGAHRRARPSICIRLHWCLVRLHRPGSSRGAK